MSRAWLSVRHLSRKGSVLGGLHGRKSSDVADMQSCAVLPSHVRALPMPLRALIGSMGQAPRLLDVQPHERAIDGSTVSRTAAA